MLRAARAFFPLSSRVFFPVRSRVRFSTSMGAVGTQMVDTSARVAALRELMAKKENNVDAFVVPSEDQREL
jgi:hypothetical protein